MVQTADVGALDEACKEDVHLPVVVIVRTRNNRRVDDRWKDGGQECENIAAFVAEHLDDGPAKSVTASDQEIESAVVIKVGPRYRTAIQPDEGNRDFGEAPAPIITIEPGLPLPIAIVAVEQQIKFAIIIIIGPGGGALREGSQGDHEIRKDAILVVIEINAVVILKQQIQGAVVIVIGPGEDVEVAGREIDCAIIEVGKLERARRTERPADAVGG